MDLGQARSALVVQGALRTSSSSCLTIDPIRMTLAGCSTNSAGLRGWLSLLSSPPVWATPMPSGVTKTIRLGVSAARSGCPASSAVSDVSVGLLGALCGGWLIAPSCQTRSQETVRRILPMCPLASMARCAAGACASG